jgi:site-specific recombinase XerD
MGAAEIEAFLTHLAVDQKVASSTQNQALSALLFLYREVLRLPIDLAIGSVRAQKPKRLPTVLSKEEVRRVISGMSGTHCRYARRVAEHDCLDGEEHVTDEHDREQGNLDHAEDGRCDDVAHHA